MVKIPIIAERRRTTRRRAPSTAEPTSGLRPDDRTALAADIEQLNPPSREAILQRVLALLRVLPEDHDNSERFAADSSSAILTGLFDALTVLRSAEAWLVLAAINGRMPAADEVVRAVRKAELDGPATAVTAIVREWIDTGQHDRRRITVVTGQYLLDVQHTSRTDFATGIQRVTREVTRRWLIAHDAAPVGWREDFSGMRLLSRPEIHRACWGGRPVTIPTDDDTIVPWNCTYVLPELAAESSRAGHLQTMAQFSNTTLNMIGYDLVPMTTAETSHEGIVPGFARNLAAARYARVIVPISEAAGGEYQGWRSMLAGSGLAGPRIEPVLLPAEAPPDDPDVLAAARQRLVIGALPLVLVVGSHEPRKNHLAVLHAAELLWREGQQFSLTFIGGNAWNSGEFTQTLARLSTAGRPVEAILAATDDLLWGGYRTARFTVFPSLNEGFGLPVAESLACGTPVVTSDFGSMREIAEEGGAVLVDPRDDHSIAAGMRALLIDEKLHARLTAEARARTGRTWDLYAAESWSRLAAGVAEPQTATVTRRVAAPARPG